MSYPTIHLISSIGQTLDPGVDFSAPISDVKQQIADQGGVPPTLNELLYQSQVLDDSATLDDYNIEPGDSLVVNVQSGVVTYPMTDAMTPPLGADQLAHLRDGSVLGQKVTGVAAGSTYQLAFYARGSVRWTVEFLDGADVVIGTPATDDVAEPGSDLAPFTDTVLAPVGAVAANLRFQANGSAVLFDLVSFRST